MDYTQFFRSLREARGFTIEELAERARRHRNTILNLESGRPVKFKTIAGLMEKLGYAADSEEMRSIALLWLEAVSGIPVSRRPVRAAAQKNIASYRSHLQRTARELETAAIDAGLKESQLQALLFAIRHPAALSILEDIRDLVLQLSVPAEAPALRAAEE